MKHVEREIETSKERKKERAREKERTKERGKQMKEERDLYYKSEMGGCDERKRVRKIS